jgi:hypothetical protein
MASERFLRAPVLDDVVLAQGDQPAQQTLD